MRCPTQRPHKRHRAATAALDSGADVREPRPRRVGRATCVPHMLLCVLGLLGTSNTALAYPVAAQRPSTAALKARTQPQGELRGGAPAAGDAGPEGHVLRAPAELEHATVTNSKQLGFRTTSKSHAISSGEAGADAWTVSPGFWTEVELKLCDDTDATASNCTLESPGPASTEAQAHALGAGTLRHGKPLRADTTPLATRNATSSLARAWDASGSLRQILMAKKGKGKRAKKQRLLDMLPKCSLCAIEKCFRSKKVSHRARCVGKCKKKGKIHSCNSTKNDFRTCTRDALGQCWHSTCENPDLPLEPLNPLSSIIVSTSAPFIPCVVTTNHPTGCPAPGMAPARSRGFARLLASTCVNYEHRLSRCESPYFPFGYCECRFVERDAATGRVRRVTRPCHADEFDGEDIPLVSAAGGSVKTRVSEHVYESKSATFTYSTTLLTEEGPAAITMEYFRGFSVVADRFTYTGEYADDYREDAYERRDTSAAGSGEDEFDDYINFVAIDYARDYVNEYTGDSGGGSGDYGGDEVYDFRREYEYVVDDDAAYDYTVNEAVEEYYFEQHYNLPVEVVCALRCSFEGGGVLGSVQEEYGMDGPYSVYYDGLPVPYDNCPACLALGDGGGDVSVDPGTPLEPGEFEVFLGAVPEAERFVAGEVAGES